MWTRAKEGRSRGRRRWASLLAGLTVATSGLVAAAAPAHAALSEPAADPFYAAPANLSATPGTVLRERPVTVALYGDTPEKLSAWQVLYRTTDAQGDPEATVATLLEPRGAAPAGGRPLVSYQVAEDSLGSQCAPSYELQQGATSTNAVEQTEIFLIDALLEQGWAVVVPDYEGPASAYGAGVQAGHAVLDGIRAAEHFSPAGLSRSTPVGLWGYSGGALATAWSSELQPTYAPELHLVGTAEGGVPVNLAHIAERINGGPFAGYYLAGVVGLARAYPNLMTLLGQILTAAGKAAASEVGGECNSTIVSNFALKNIVHYVNVPNPLSLPEAQQVLAENTLGQNRPRGPLYVYQAVEDELIPIADVDGLMATYCREGVTVDYQRNLASDHLTLVGTGAFAALNWLESRFAGTPAPNTCATGGQTSLSTLTQPVSVTTFLAYLAKYPTLF